MTKDDGSPRFPGGYADYIVQPRAPARHRLARRLARRRRREARARARPTRPARRATSPTAASGSARVAGRAALVQARQPRLSRLRGADGLHRQGGADPAAALQRAAAEVPARGAGPRHDPAARARTASASRRYFDPLPFWYPPFENDASGRASRCTRSRSGRWRCTTPGARRTPGCARSTAATGSTSTARRAAALGLADDDWVWVTSRHGRIKAQVRLMEGVQSRHRAGPGTRSASARAPGTSRPNAPEALQGFLLNHLIDELLPERESGYRYANADPVTGQAAWYDLRVRIERAAAERGRHQRAAVRACCARRPGLAAPPRGLALRRRVPPRAERRRVTSLPQDAAAASASAS